MPSAGCGHVAVMPFAVSFMAATSAGTRSGVAGGAGEAKAGCQAGWCPPAPLAAWLNKICFMQSRRRWEVPEGHDVATHLQSGGWFLATYITVSSLQKKLFVASFLGKTIAGFSYDCWISDGESQMEKRRGCEKKKSRAKKNNLESLNV